MRILHLFDALTDPLPQTRLALLAQSMGRIAHAEQDLCLLGPRAADDAARALHLTPRWRITAPCRLPVMAYFALRRQVRAGDYDLVHCWSAGATGSATLAMLLAPHVPRLVSVTQMPSADQARWARVLGGESSAPTTYLAISQTIRHALLTRGLSAQAVHTLRPAVDMGLVAHNQRQALRESWGVSDSTLVVALVSDPVESADSLKAHMATGVADQALRTEGRSLALLVHPGQHRRDRSMAMARAVGLRDGLIVDERLAKPWEVLPGCDIALAMGPAGSGLALLWAMAANIPIAAEATQAICELVEDRHSALLAKPGLTRALSHRLTQIAQDAPLAWKLRDTARHEAFSLFSRQQYVQSLAAVYQQVAQRKPVDVPPPATTGGLRFAGRA